MTLLELLTHILLTLLSLATAYLWFLALLGMVARRRHPSAPVMRCAILVPAHDEEGGIRDTIASLLRLDDARGSVIYVIADNCSDGTAEVARQFPVEVLERVDPENRGKGYALEWAVEQIELSRFDAVVVIDADTIVGRDLLSAVSRRWPPACSG